MSYKVLNEKDRASGFIGDNAKAKCDQNSVITPAWYRFSGAAGDKMADACVPQKRCGTHAPGWLNGAHPVNVGNTVKRKVCFHWGSKCCTWSVEIRVKKCNGFFVYELQRTPTCYLRYCGNAGLRKQSKPKLKLGYVNIGNQNGSFSLCHYFTTTPRIHFVFPFLFNFCNPRGT